MLKPTNIVLAIVLAFAMTHAGVAHAGPTNGAVISLSASTYTVKQSAGFLKVVIERTGDIRQSGRVDYHTVDGTARSGTDYSDTSGAAYWAPGDATSRWITIPIREAPPFIGTRGFSFVVAGPANAALGNPSAARITIDGEAAASVLALGSSSYSVAPGAESVEVTVTRSGALSGAASVAYTTSNGTAVAGTDYTSASGTLHWAANEGTAKTFTLAVANPARRGTSATFKLTLSSPAGGGALGAPSTAAITIRGASTNAPAIRVAGNRLVDANGGTVQLRGVNVSGLEFVAISGLDPSNPWGGQTGTPTPDWTTIKSWGVNAVRLGLNEASWLGLTCVNIGGNKHAPGAMLKADPGGNYQATVEQSVAEATAAGLYVILDLHWSAPNRGSIPICPTYQNAMADADHSTTFWRSVATHFKNNPAVIFELFNEPFFFSNQIVGNTPWLDLLHGGRVTQLYYANFVDAINFTWSTVGMQQLVDAVRATGAANVVLTSTLDASHAMDGWLDYMPTDPAGQLAAVWHAYASPQYPTQVSCSWDGLVTVDLPECSALEMTAVQNILAAGYPVVITEFGDTIGGPTSPWASRLLPFADANGISYLAWTWDTWTGATSNVLITDPTGDPTAGYGAYVKQHYLCRARGAPRCP